LYKLTFGCAAACSVSDKASAAMMASLVSPWSKLPVDGKPARCASGEMTASGKKRLSMGVEEEMYS
jgi:hypothetical protein